MGTLILVLRQHNIHCEHLLPHTPTTPPPRLPTRLPLPPCSPLLPWASWLPLLLRQYAIPQLHNDSVFTISVATTTSADRPISPEDGGHVCWVTHHSYTWVRLPSSMAGSSSEPQPGRPSRCPPADVLYTTITSATAPLPLTGQTCKASAP